MGKKGGENFKKQKERRKHFVMNMQLSGRRGREGRKGEGKKVRGGEGKEGRGRKGGDWREGSRGKGRGKKRKARNYIKERKN